MTESRPTIYSFAEPKEPDKKTSWSAVIDKALPELRDHEADKADRRAALIKERMSAPGALRLPPLLEEMRWRYSITDGAFKSQASFDRIFVFPIDPFDNADKLPGSFLYRANKSKLKDLQEGHRGVLISAGLVAADRLASNGIELGHIVTTNKNVPFARRCEVLEDEQLFYLVMRDGDLAGSETLAEELRSGDKTITDAGGDDAYCHVIDGVKKQSVYVQDSW